MAPEKYARLWYAHGGQSGAKPRQSDADFVWHPGLPTHWQVQSTRMRILSNVARIAMLFQVVTSVIYLQYRARNTIGVFERSRQPGWFSLQILFLMYEIFVLALIVLQIPESWNKVSRNSVNLKEIPNHLISPFFQHPASTVVRPQYSNYPSVDVIIPCYDETVSLVGQVVRAALRIEYPSELLSIYLCDDGKDEFKREMVQKLQKHHSNIHYIARPTNEHAKPGNVNYALERTSGHLIVQLDADFVPRSKIIQRLLPYYFVWNSDLQLYEFNETLAVVQSPQHYRNLSPHDHDVFDQRNIFFYNSTLVGKDWINAASMVGTSNLINRVALEKSGNFPYHSVGDDTALSVIFHGLGYRTYYVNESLATGLCPGTLRGNFAQRGRWYRSDFQILFSRHGPLSQPGLSWFQRISYLNLSLYRFLAIANIFLDLSMVLVLTAGFSVVDVTNETTFIIFLGLYMFGGIIARFLICLGRPGHLKSSSANEIFEVIFKYTTTKGLFIVLFSRNRLRWKSGEKIVNEAASEETSSNSEETKSEESADTPPKEYTQFGSRPSVEKSEEDPRSDTSVAISLEPATVVEHINNKPEAPSDKPNDKILSTPPKAEKNDIDLKNTSTLSTPINANRVQIPIDPSNEDHTKTKYFKFVCMNLKRCWYNLAMIAVFTFAIVWGLANPTLAARSAEIIEENGVKGRREYSNLLPTGIALAYLIGALLCHFLAVFLCFKKRYLTGWVLEDLENGRCDQFAVHDKTKRQYVPRSVVSWINLVRFGLLIAALIYVIVFTIRDKGTFIPNDS